MNERQQAMYDFAMARVQPGKEDELKTFLAERFKAQDAARAAGEGFNRERMRETAEKVMALLTPEGAKAFEAWREERRAARRRERQG